ncbi:MAG: PIG-L family deacetylase [Alphaproteobacteria bacterium]|nr:PIG-L family deacetylase [Alphaproteobacteria bacterium]
MLHLFLSPHFDDVVGSCGGTLARLRDLRATARIHTVFGGSPGDILSPEAQRLHDVWGLGGDPVAVRREEDREAARRLGTSASASLIPEALYRCDPNGQWLYPTHSSRVGPLHHSDRQLGVALARSLAARYPGRVRFYAPLGIGQHADHRIVAGVGAVLHQMGRRVVFYEDFWYRSRGPWTPIDGLRPASCRVSRTQRERHLYAFAAYRSQIPMLFGTTANLAAAMSANDQSADGNAFVERFWLPPRHQWRGTRAA